MEHMKRRSFLKQAGAAAAVWTLPAHKTQSGVRKQGRDYTSRVPTN
jgi:hypothetical protein